MTEQKAAGILILQYGKIRLERYALGFSDAERWTSQSVVKSFVDGMRLSGSVWRTAGQWVSIARRKGSSWYVGTIINSTARTVTVPLDFLQAGTYDATIYKEHPDAANNPKLWLKGWKRLLLRINLWSIYLRLVGKSLGCNFNVLRRGRDSNPWYPFEYTHFPGVPVQPLLHPSEGQQKYWKIGIWQGN